MIRKKENSSPDIIMERVAAVFIEEKNFFYRGSVKEDLHESKQFHPFKSVLDGPNFK